MKPSYREAVTEASKRDKKLRADNPRLNIGGVYLSHDDGSSFFWQSAFVERWRGYVMVFTEHHGFRVYDNDDVVTVAETQRNKRT